MSRQFCSRLSAMPNARNPWFQGTDSKSRYPNKYVLLCSHRGRNGQSRCQETVPMRLFLVLHDCLGPSAKASLCTKTRDVIDSTGCCKLIAVITWQKYCTSFATDLSLLCDSCVVGWTRSCQLVDDLLLDSQPWQLRPFSAPTQLGGSTSAQAGGKTQVARFRFGPI